MRALKKILQGWGWYRPRGFSLRAAPSARYDAWRIHGKNGSVIQMGDRCIFEGVIVCDRAGAEVQIGDRTFVGDSLIVSASSVIIGDDVLVSWGVTIVDHDSHVVDFANRSADVTDWYDDRKDWNQVAVSPVYIGDKAWIGFGATILKGITVGEGTVVGACSVVTRDVEPWTVVAGNPARQLRRLEHAS